MAASAENFNRYVTHREFTRAVDELHAKIVQLPEDVIHAVDRQRRADRRRFLRDLFALTVGVATIIGAIAAVIALVVG